MHSRLMPAAVLALSALAGPLLAAPIDPLNARQVVINPSPSYETSLQQILTGGAMPVFVDSTLDVQRDQSAYGMFGGSTALETIELRPTLAAEYTAGAPTQRFGIWFGNDSSQLLHVDLLLGGAVVGDAAAVSISNGLLQIGAGTGSCAVSIACQTISDTRITTGDFGFYFQTRPGVARLHTVDSLNDYPTPARVLGFNGGGSNWAFSYEDHQDFDYQDMVVSVGNISAVPEPGALGLALAGGLIAFGLRRRSSIAGDVSHCG